MFILFVFIKESNGHTYHITNKTFKMPQIILSFTGANVVTKKRTRMKPNKVEQTVIIKENKSTIEAFLKKNI